MASRGVCRDCCLSGSRGHGRLEWDTVWQAAPSRPQERTKGRPSLPLAVCRCFLCLPGLLFIGQDANELIFRSAALRPSRVAAVVQLVETG